ncbi:MAG: nucleotidyltransferase domain-containing protein [Candidatus Dadabacteria bacterium]|nr:nucleotidyltransferase domain-containing protein [Candidatus Dadabacteria bacterium]
MYKIVEIRSGSHLYGTATKDSDVDVKAVYLPSARDILLQKVRPVISESRLKDPGEKNTAEDVDYESYSPEKFLRLLGDGQTVALDMLFAPGSSMLREPDPLWVDIQALAPRILNKKAASFVKYCRRQANKYGTKGLRAAAARQALDFLTQAEKEYGASEKLVCVASEIEKLTESSEFLMTGEMTHPNGGKSSYFEICGKKALLSASIQSACTMVRHLVEEYGERSLTAEKNEGVDWKALYHAVRVGREAIEFLSAHRITFPRPEAEHLLAIKQGRVGFEDVSEEIETILEDVETAARLSTLPEAYDDRIIDDFIENLHRKIVVAELGSD